MVKIIKAGAAAPVADPEPPARTAPAVRFKSEEDGIAHVELRGDVERLNGATGNPAVTNSLISQIVSLGSQGRKFDDAASTFALGFVDSMQPEDSAEALLLAQMAAVHQSTMMLARRLNHVEHIPQQDAAERALNKLARTFAAQMDTLKRYRSKGQQIVRVERVTVESGAQAVVGDVHHGGRGR